MSPRHRWSEKCRCPPVPHRRATASPGRWPGRPAPGWEGVAYGRPGCAAVGGLPDAAARTPNVQRRRCCGMYGDCVNASDRPKTTVVDASGPDRRPLSGRSHGTMISIAKSEVKVVFAATVEAAPRLEKAAIDKIARLTAAEKSTILFTRANCQVCERAVRSQVSCGVLRLNQRPPVPTYYRRQ
jgi:hypothetical protein